MGDDTWEQLLRWHDRILRAEFARWRGEEVKHGGDGFFVAFGQPDDGIACATAIQRALARHRADHGFAPTVRIGLHAGEATARDDDYFGAAVTRAARISAAAGAGEVLVSAELLDGCERTVPVAGERTLELKGIAEPLPAVLIAWSDESGAEPTVSVTMGVTRISPSAAMLFSSRSDRWSAGNQERDSKVPMGDRQKRHIEHRRLRTDDHARSTFLKEL